MIDNNHNNPCRIFLCYRSNTAETAKSIFLALKRCSQRNYGRVWYSDFETVGNYCVDIPTILCSAEYVILFIKEGFTRNFLNDDGTTNFYTNRITDNNCITAGEIIEIEKQRQKRKNLTIISINVDGESLSNSDLETLLTLFKNENIIREDSIQFYQNLNCCKFDSRTDDPDKFIDVFDGFGLALDEAERFTQVVQVDLTALHQPICSHYYGREFLFSRIEDAIVGKESAICIYGNIGEGKTAFAHSLLNKLASQNYLGAQYVFYWEFTSNAGEYYNIADGINQFLLALLRFFNIKDEKKLCGEELQVKSICDIIMKRRVILILDGFELLQQSNDNNSISNQTIRYLVTTIARDAATEGSLLLLLSTKSVCELDYYGHNSSNIYITALNEEDSVKIMTSLGVYGEESLMKSTAMELGYNPLALSLLSLHLVKNHDGNIIGKLESSSVLPLTRNKHNLFVVEEILNYYHCIWDQDSYEWQLLSLLSIIRHDIPLETFAQIVASCDFLSGFNSLVLQERKHVIGRLKESPLIVSGRFSLLTIFKDAIFDWCKEKKTEYFYQCCSILSSFYLNLFKEEYVSNVIDMEPIYDAIYYLVLKREYNYAISLFWEKVLRERTFFSQKVLGIMSNDIFTVSLFFNVPQKWEIISSSINDIDAAWLCSVAAYLMNNIGMLQESEILRRKEIAYYKKTGNSIFVASDGMHLARNLMLQCKFLEAETQFNSIIEMINSGGMVSVSNKYSKAIDVDELRKSINTRFAFLLYLQGPSSYRYAESLLDTFDLSATGKTYYYIIKCAVDENNAKILKQLKKEITDSLTSALELGKGHEIAYCYYLQALIRCKQYLQNKRKTSRGKTIGLILIDIGKSIDYSEKVWRMDQYPFVLLCVLDILIDLFQDDNDGDILSEIEKVKEKLKNVFEFCSILLYKELYAMELLKYAAKRNDKEETSRIQKLIEKEYPTGYAFFRERIKMYIGG